MSPATFILIFGLLLTFTPALVLLLRCGMGPEALYLALTRMRLEELFLLQAFKRTGVALLSLGVIALATGVLR